MINPNNALKRIKREYDDYLKNPLPGIQLILDSNNQYHMTAFLDGPSNSPYEDGQFQLDIIFPPEYPFQPPEVTFLTQVFHPNVQDVDICLDILSDRWSPALKIQQVLISISSFLVDPCPENGFGNEASNLLNYGQTDEFNRIAREWTLEYAPSPAILKQRIQQEAELAAQSLLNQVQYKINEENKLQHSEIDKVPLQLEKVQSIDNSQNISSDLTQKSSLDQLKEQQFVQ